jgi:hypothetical protein
MSGQCDFVIRGSADLSWFKHRAIHHDSHVGLHPLFLRRARRCCDTSSEKCGYDAPAESEAAQGFRFRPPLLMNACPRQRNPQGRSPPCLSQEVIADSSGFDTTLLSAGGIRAIGSAGMVFAS